jgi:hypothetical protein
MHANAGAGEDLHPHGPLFVAQRRVSRDGLRVPPEPAGRGTVSSRKTKTRPGWNRTRTPPTPPPFPVLTGQVSSLTPY